MKRVVQTGQIILNLAKVVCSWKNLLFQEMPFDRYMPNHTLTGHPIFWRVWITLEEEEFSWAMHKIHKQNENKIS